MSSPKINMNNANTDDYPIIVATRSCFEPIVEAWNRRSRILQRIVDVMKQKLSKTDEEIIFDKIYEDDLNETMTYPSLWQELFNLIHISNDVPDCDVALLLKSKIAEFGFPELTETDDKIPREYLQSIFDNLPLATTPSICYTMSILSSYQLTFRLCKEDCGHHRPLVTRQTHFGELSQAALDSWFRSPELSCTHHRKYC